MIYYQFILTFHILCCIINVVNYLLWRWIILENEYEHSICKYCNQRNCWDCSDNNYPIKGCGNWTLDSNTLSNVQLQKIKNVLLYNMMESETDDYYE